MTRKHSDSSEADSKTVCSARKKSLPKSLEPEVAAISGSDPVPQETEAMSLANFVGEAWTILEPVAEMQWNWHLTLICEYLTLIQQNQFKNAVGECKEGIIFNVPPRIMKSLLISVFFPAWAWTLDPSRRFLFASYSEKRRRNPDCQRHHRRQLHQQPGL